MKNRQGKNRQESLHQSALSTHHHTRKAKPSEQARHYGNQGGYSTGYRDSWGEGNASSNSDEILFEVFHCLQTGRDYSVINVDGVRYLVNSWDAGTLFVCLFIFLLLLIFICCGRCLDWRRLGGARNSWGLHNADNTLLGMRRSIYLPCEHSALSIQIL